MTEVSVETCFLNSKVLSFSLNIYCEISQSKTDNLCLNISGFVVVLSFGDSEGVDFSDLILNHAVLGIYFSA